LRALVLEHPGPVAGAPLIQREVSTPEPAAGELLLRAAACAVCRTDLQLGEGDLTARRLPIVPGHQIVGRVEAVGLGVSDWEVGARAGVTWLAGSCGHCDRCREGRENLCALAAFTGWDRDGGFAEFAAARADVAVRLPDVIDDWAAAPLLCGGVIGYRSLHVCGIQPGGRLGLFGFGASARWAIQVALHWGCSVYVCTRSEPERRRALELGAVWAGAYDETPPQPLDAAITFAPAGDVVVAALRALDRGGTVAVNAIHLDRMPEFPYDLLWWDRWCAAESAEASCCSLSLSWVPSRASRSSHASAPSAGAGTSSSGSISPWRSGCGARSAWLRGWRSPPTHWHSRSPVPSARRGNGAPAQVATEAQVASVLLYDLRRRALCQVGSSSTGWDSEISSHVRRTTACATASSGSCLGPAGRTSAALGVVASTLSGGGMARISLYLVARKTDRASGHSASSGSAIPAQA
jgi:alcohol dehydrogenase, propanol-preferring